MAFSLFYPTTTTTMTATTFTTSSNPSLYPPKQQHQQQSPTPFFRNAISVCSPNLVGLRRLAICSAAKQQRGDPAKKKKPPPNDSNQLKTKKKKQKQINPKADDDEGDAFCLDRMNDDGYVDGVENDEQQRYQPPPLPRPPAGFVVDDQGRVLMVSDKRIATIVDSTNNFPLECIIRRVFKSSQGDECMLLCPLDMPVQILKSTNVEGWSAISDDEVEAILPNAAYALAKIHIHLVHSGFCYTARGGFCYTEDDIIEFRTDDGHEVQGLPTEGIEITCFHLGGSHYMIYTPSDPLLFVAVKGKNGQLQIADDDLLDDPAVISAIDEDTEFNALVEEEAALLDSLLGKR